MFPGPETNLADSKLFTLVETLLRSDHVYRAMGGTPVARPVTDLMGNNDREGVQQNIHRYTLWKLLLALASETHGSSCGLTNLRPISLYLNIGVDQLPQL